MPMLRGTEVLPRLKTIYNANKLLTEPLYIMLTACPDSNIEALARSKGVDCFHKKPLAASIISDVIR